MEGEEHDGENDPTVLVNVAGSHPAYPATVCLVERNNVIAASEVHNSLLSPALW